MPNHFRTLTLTPAVLRAQDRHYGRHHGPDPAPAQDVLTPDEIEFIRRRDSFYLGTVNADGWPYIQHRGGPAGFLKVLTPQRLGFADFKGNRQLLSTGNLDGNDRVALFLMDYPRRERLKILGHARVLEARAHRALADELSPAPELRQDIERLVLIDVAGFDWNCPQHITPRYTVAEMEEFLSPLRQRIRELEARLAASGAAP